MKLKERINEYLKQQNFTEEDIKFLDSSSVYIAEQISMYAHRNQKRVNGDNYFTHPYSVMQSYRNLVGIVENDYFCLDVDLLVGKYNIPFDGVQEICLLHDVLEDTDVTIEEMEEVFEGLSLGSYFKMRIKEYLLLLTHNENDDYQTYVSKLLVNPVTSLVKLLDLADNIRPSSLTCFGDYELQRTQKYATYFKIINDKWHFLESADGYRKEFNSKKNCN